MAESLSPEPFTIKCLPEDAALGSIREYAKGMLLWGHGDPVDSVYFLRRGQVCLMLKDRRGRESIIRMVQPGEVFGLTALSPARRQSAPTSAVAGVSSEVLVVRYDEFLDFLSRDHQAAFALIATLGERLAYTQDRLHVLINHSAVDRVCALLEQLAMRVGRPSRSNPGFTTMHLTHEQIAMSAGLTRSHVSIIMARLRAQGVVRYGRSMPLLVDLEAVGRITEHADNLGETEAEHSEVG